MDQRTLFLVNAFIINTVELLNKLSGTCEEKLAQVHQRILRVDAALALLEAKLASVDVRQEESAQAEETGEQVTEQVTEKQVEVPVEDDPKMAKFVKMQQVGVPEQAVKLQMSLEGFDPAALDTS